MVKNNGDKAAIATIRSLRDVPEQNLKTIKKKLRRIERGRSNGNPCNGDMEKLFHFEEVSHTSELHDEPELNHEEEEEEARRVGGGSFSTEDVKEYRGIRNPNEVVSKELEEMDTVFTTACTNALFDGYLKYLKSSRKRTDMADFKRFQKWVVRNITTPLEKLAALVSCNEDHNALFTALTRSASLELRCLPESGNHYSCVLSGKRLDCNSCTEVVLIDDPRLFKPLQPKATQSFSDKPHSFIIQNRFSNLVYSVFHLHTFLDNIGVRCLRWAEEKQLLHKHVPKIIASYVDSNPELPQQLLKQIEISRLTVEKYCEERRT